ncbi:hypothetical protein E4T80_09845 [Muribacter muris]|uniref:Uncharacterized protein n=1 Tax=Muribacter muris TaxID=67855 RepID=A0A4Y9JTD2_9PAST|nr:hypothetical protein [Muribacter muris]MBF0785760.1 hypothetical protein [Muribacter muris]MBF0828268.1 hypothetical protein [Muribacter muris]TFV08582.1 hypothetical protein E4T80_09845 [Muribacter muris]
MAKYDWETIKTQFITSTLSIEEFAKQNAIPVGTLRRQVSLGKWVEERDRLKIEVRSKTTEYIVNNRAATLAKFDDDCVSLADEFRQKAREFLHQIDSPMALKALTGAMKDTQAIARLALGASTENQATKAVSDFSDWLENLNNGTG